MTDTPEPDTGTDDTTEQPATPATPPDPPPVPGMTWDGTRWIADSTEDTTRAERRRPRSDEFYRSQLREVEAQRDRLQERVDAHDRERAERDIANILLTPADLWFDASIDDCRDEQGCYSADLAVEAARRCAKAHPNWTASPAAPANMVGWAASKPETTGEGQTFTDAFRPRQR